MISLVNDIIATRRLTRLITDDEITTPLRDFIYEHTKPGGKLQYLITCPWCISIYAGAIIFLLRKTNPELADYLSSTLTASEITGLLATYLQ